MEPGADMGFLRAMIILFSKSYKCNVLLQSIFISETITNKVSMKKVFLFSFFPKDFITFTP